MSEAEGGEGVTFGAGAGGGSAGGEVASVGAGSVASEEGGGDGAPSREKEAERRLEQAVAAAEAEEDDEGGAAVVVSSQEGREFRMSRRAALRSTLLKTMLDAGADGGAGGEDSESEGEEDGGAAAAEGVEEVPLPSVRALELARAVRYCKHYRGGGEPAIPMPLPHGDLRQLLPDWDADFVLSLSNTELLELVLAANYMGVEPLLDLTCARVGALCKQLPQDKLEEAFRVPFFSFPAEEERAIREEEEWIRKAAEASAEGEGET